jgi:ribonuclease I
MRLVQLMNESAVVTDVVGPAVGKTLDAAALQRAIDDAFGASASKKLELSCNDSHELVEVRISLPASIQPNETLQSILQRAPDAKPSRCPARMRIVAYRD